MLCSVLAGVYNEVLLKGSDSAKRGVTTNLQRLALRRFGGLAIGGPDCRRVPDVLAPQDSCYVHPVHCGEFCGAELGGKGRLNCRQLQECINLSRKTQEVQGC